MYETLEENFWNSMLQWTNYHASTPSTAPSTPFELLFHTSPKYTNLKVFGCLCYPWLKPYTKNKLALHSSPCVFMGFSKLHKGYICLDHISGKSYISRHVVFFEQVFPFSANIDKSSCSPAHHNGPIFLPPILAPMHELSQTSPTVPQSTSTAGILGPPPPFQPLHIL